MPPFKSSQCYKQLFLGSHHTNLHISVPTKVRGNKIEAMCQKWRSSQEWSTVDYTAILTLWPRWVSVYIWVFVSIWVSIYLCVGSWVGEEATWMSLSLIKKCKTICHSLSLPEVEPVNIFLEMLTLGRKEEVWREMVAVVGIMTDSHHFFPRLWNLGNWMQIHSFILV